MPKSTTPRDVFVHILLIVTLYMSVGAVITLLFDQINILYPEQYDYYRGTLESIRWSTAMLIVSFPVYLLLSVFATKLIVKEPERAESRIRKWLLYLTLFLAALLLIADVVTLIYYFLNGELTARFLLKVLVVLITGGAVFGYYLWDLREWTRGHVSASRLCGIAASIAVLAVIVCSFLVAGSPWQQRKVRMDDQRVTDLSTIQSQIINHWTMKGRIPDQLDELVSSIPSVTPPTDPVTHAAYEYKRIKDLEFELCATFEAKSLTNDKAGYDRPYDPYMQDANWDHGEGRTCFTRTIDPELQRKEPPVMY